MVLDHDNDDVMLEPEDCVLRGDQAQNGYLEHPGNKKLGNLIEKHVASYALAPTVDERSNVLARIEAEARAINDKNGRQSRFLVLKEGSTSSNAVFREATPEEIKLEIHDLIRAMFTKIPKDGDVLIYTGESLHNQSHIGNQRLHVLIRSLCRIFPLAAQRRGLVNVPRDIVILRGSEFLIPLHENRLQDGCIPADPESRDRMLAQLLEYSNGIFEGTRNPGT